MSIKKKEVVYHFDPLKIKYLSFEGGGGKGVAFVGAIAALEKMKVINHKASNGVVVPGTILGISGASAGAITGFLLSLGYDSIDIAKKLSSTQTFIDFYDGPEVGKTRGVIVNESIKSKSAKFLNDGTDWRLDIFEKGTKNGYFEIISDAVDSFPDHWFLNWGGYLSLVIGLGLGGGAFGTDNKIASTGSAFLSGVGISLFGVSLGASLFIPSKVKNEIQKLGEIDESDINKGIENPFKDLIDKIAPDGDTLKKYLKNVLMDRGLFPGFALRNFFRDLLLEKYGRPNDKEFNPSFKDFCNNVKNIELKVVSVNSTTHRPQIFSQKETPLFPVIDAVGMSSSFPFAFKPVLVWGCQSSLVDGKKTGPPNGYYLDGGLLVNLPIHLFDEATDGKLNENMLALRLETLHPEHEKKERDKKGAMDILGGYAGDLMNTTLFPSEEGQIRNESERQQTINLDVSGLETLQFVSPIEKSGPKIIEAYIKTRFMLDKNFKVKKGTTLIFDPTKHYNGITIAEGTSKNTVENTNAPFYEIDASKFETVLGEGLDNVEDKKGKMVLKLIENIIDKENKGTFAKMLEDLKKKRVN